MSWGFSHLSTCVTLAVIQTSPQSRGSQLVPVIICLHNVQGSVAPCLLFWLYKHQRKTLWCPNQHLYLSCGESILACWGPSNISFYSIPPCYERSHN